MGVLMADIFGVESIANEIFYSRKVSSSYYVEEILALLSLRFF
jgi:hypothetical protein